jgi:hypothetical protein
MRIRIAVAAAALIAAAVALPRSPRAEDPAPSYVAHEWGTFTSMQGSDGITLEGLHHEEESLPGFVYSRTEIRECPLREFGYKGLETPVDNVTEKMETPVIYFYADAPVHVRTRVCFNRGLLSQWYPVSDKLGPPERSVEAGPLDMATVDKSYLEWDFDVLSKGDGLDQIPPVAGDDPWAFARIPDSNVIRTSGRKHPRLGPSEAEKFIFYRGLGRFTLPIAARTETGYRVTLTNSGGEPIRHLFAVHVDRGVGRFAYVPEAPAGRETAIDALGLEKAAPVGDMVARLMPALKSKLVAEGLYEAEAEAMVRTWERSYFHTEGLRILYILPPKAVDAVLPIAFDPAPRELVRVLVGRLECITPEVEAEVEGALRDCRSADDAARQSAQARLDRLGRFLEPHVRRVLSFTTDPAVRKHGEEILATLSRAGGDNIRPPQEKKSAGKDVKKK